MITTTEINMNILKIWFVFGSAFMVISPLAGMDDKNENGKRPPVNDVRDDSPKCNDKPVFDLDDFLGQFDTDDFSFLNDEPQDLALQKPSLIDKQIYAEPEYNFFSDNEVVLKKLPLFAINKSSTKIAIDKQKRAAQNITFVPTMESMLLKLPLPPVKQSSKEITLVSVCLISPFKEVFNACVNPEDTIQDIAYSFRDLQRGIHSIKYFVGDRELGTQYNNNNTLNAFGIPKVPVQSYYYSSGEAPTKTPDFFIIRVKDPSSYSSYFNIPVQKTFTAAYADTVCKNFFHDDYWWDDKGQNLHNKDEFINSLKFLWLKNNIREPGYVELKSFGNKTLEEINFFHYNTIFMPKAYVMFVCPEKYVHKSQKK